jgi:hypothetical protein
MVAGVLGLVRASRPTQRFAEFKKIIFVSPAPL